MTEVPELTRQKGGVAVRCTAHFGHAQMPATS